MRPKGEIGFGYVHQFGAKAIEDWHRRSEQEKMIDDEYNEGGAALSSDYLGSLLARSRANPEHFAVKDAIYHVLTNVRAGAETTGISLSATAYFLGKEPRVLEKLRKELEETRENIESRQVSVKEAYNLQYLQAVIKESLRMFPAVGLNMPRVVPRGGLKILDRLFPEGVRILILSWLP